MNEYWKDVPGFFDFQDVYDEAVAQARNGDSLVEVGTLFGRSALYMAARIAESGKKLEFYVCDTWQLKDVPGGTDYFRTPRVDAELRKHGTLYNAFQHYVEASQLEEYITVLRKPSTVAATEFSAAHLTSFVFIDADHSYAGCAGDIDAWRPAIRSGGTIAGHDYDPSWPGVKLAVEQRFGGRVQIMGNSWRVQL